MTTTSILAALLLLSAQSSAEDETTEATAAAMSAEEKAAAEEEAYENEVVCKRTAIVGSKFKKKICATRKQWALERERSRQETSNLQRRSRGFEPGN